MQPLFPIVFQIRPLSLYSLRLPFTAQTAASYPLPPPSTIKGILANALQRCGEVDLDEAMRLVQEKVHMCTARAGGPLATSTCTMRVVYLEVGRKRRDIQPREFLHTYGMITCVAFSDDISYLKQLRGVLHQAPLHLGDSESLVNMSCYIPGETETSFRDLRNGDEASLNTYAPARFLRSFNSGIIYKMSEKFAEERTTLVPYILPLERVKGVFRPIEIRATLGRKATEVIIGQIKTLLFD